MSGTMLNARDQQKTKQNLTLVERHRKYSRKTNETSDKVKHFEREQDRDVIITKTME